MFLFIVMEPWLPLSQNVGVALEPGIQAPLPFFIHSSIPALGMVKMDSVVKVDTFGLV